VVNADPLMDHFMNPRNVGELPDANGVGEVGNPYSGNIVRLYLKIEGDTIQKATFKTLGSRAAIATSSILTEMLPGKTTVQALQITELDMLKRLGDMSPLKRHCGKVAELALKAAIGDFESKTLGKHDLLDTVRRRMQDPREWTVGAYADEPASTPL